MDIGCGTGLLSLYAASTRGVKEIYAVEADTIMHSIASKVILENQINSIKLINANSNYLSVPEDIPERVDLIASEILDCGAFGEGILSTLIHAKKNLLSEEGKIVPWKVKIFVSGYSSTELCLNRININNTFKDYIFTDKLRIVGDSDEPYDAEYVDQISDFKIITETCEALEVDFNSLQSMEEHFNGTIVKNFLLRSNIDNEYLDGFVVWFELFLNEDDPDSKISTHPSEGELFFFHWEQNFINVFENFKFCVSKWFLRLFLNFNYFTKPNFTYFTGSCWQQAIFKLKKRILVEKYEVFRLSMHCQQGILTINHEIDKDPSKVDVPIDPFALKFLNDEEYLENLEVAVEGYDGTINKCLDMSPFPYTGFVMLKESRVKELWCSTRCQELIENLAFLNCIKIELIHFVEEADLMTIADERFDVIILNPFQEVGDLNNEVICNYPIYRQLLNTNGLLIPHKISLHGELINSDWLLNCCKITNASIKAMKIDRFIDKYSTEVHFDLDWSMDYYERITHEYKIADISLDEDYHETSFKPFIRNIALPIHFIHLYFKVQLTPAISEEFAIYRRKKYCCFKRFAQIIDAKKIADYANTTIKYVQKQGLIRIECE